MAVTFLPHLIVLVLIISTCTADGDVTSTIEPLEEDDIQKIEKHLDEIQRQQKRIGNDLLVKMNVLRYLHDLRDSAFKHEFEVLQKKLDRFGDQRLQAQTGHTDQDDDVHELTTSHGTTTKSTATKATASKPLTTASTNKPTSTTTTKKMLANTVTTNRPTTTVTHKATTKITTNKPTTKTKTSKQTTVTQTKTTATTNNFRTTVATKNPQTTNPVPNKESKKPLPFFPCNTTGPCSTASLKSTSESVSISSKTSTLPTTASASVKHNTPITTTSSTSVQSLQNGRPTDKVKNTDEAPTAYGQVEEVSANKTNAKLFSSIKDTSKKVETISPTKAEVLTEKSKLLPLETSHLTTTSSVPMNTSFIAWNDSLDHGDEYVFVLDKTPSSEDNSSSRSTSNEPLTVRQSSTGHETVGARHAVDGIIDFSHNRHPCSQTAWWDTHPWWEVEFGKSIPISKVKLYNRGDCCADRMSNITITVDGHLCAEFQGPAPPGNKAQPAAVIPCKQSMYGRKLKIDKHGRYLTLCEVEWE